MQQEQAKREARKQAKQHVNTALMEPEILIHNGQRLHARQVPIPDTYNHAVQSELKDYWLDAMKSHISKLESKETWTKRPKSQMPKGARWIPGK